LQAALMPRMLGNAPNLLLLMTICQALIAGPADAAPGVLRGLALDLPTWRSECAGAACR
jgi:hypothetical protein